MKYGKYFYAIGTIPYFMANFLLVTILIKYGKYIFAIGTIPYFMANFDVEVSGVTKFV